MHYIVCIKFVHVHVCMYDRYTRYQKTCDAVFVLFAITWVVTRLGFSTWPTAPILLFFLENCKIGFVGHPLDLAVLTKF